MSNTLNIGLKRPNHNYEIRIGSDILNDCGAWAQESLAGACRKVVVVSNEPVFELFGNRVVKSLRAAGFKAFDFRIPDGERHKNSRTLLKAIDFFGSCGLKRTDAVIALGGGVVGDLAGFAAACYMRGIAFLQVPTTLLSQIDSSVGGKVGINSEFGKNTIGAFHQPAGVLIDTSTLKTLPKRELTAGFCEAVKHGILAGPRLFDKTHKFLRQRDAGGPLTEAEYSPLAELILDQVKFKASIVAGDEHEKASRSDARSRKILNFGHTVGHALEKATNYRYFRHGEAVGYGIMAAAEISKNIGILDSNVVTLLNDVVHLSGKLPVADKIDAGEVCKLVLLDKKSDGESLQWILVEAIGKPVIVSNDELEKKLVLASVKAVLRSA